MSGRSCCSAGLEQMRVALQTCPCRTHNGHVDINVAIARCTKPLHQMLAVHLLLLLAQHTQLTWCVANVHRLNRVSSGRICRAHMVQPAVRVAHRQAQSNSVRCLVRQVTDPQSLALQPGPTAKCIKPIKHCPIV